ncbi:hypothetical protein [Janthinobacterium agaricidamnosum]|uniref:Uncharacterized protein n=1 Tax=Janthinobacterium agaricidamnosum NBRC 102515 = DSM 9628 TaxID=1349767 RepID=W0V8Q7_9BURK|nr:hypothetical protein [Janthinobacterium agaricidamnosum]CDG85214.1 hypothetical protein GJA_4607 [Janthinobacterium agaricidamnosum NBRC 102515 = DSM 9628]
MKQAGAQLNEAMQEQALAMARAGMTSFEAIGFFRVTVGLFYLAGLMTEDALDFKKIDAQYNRFIYRSIGGGHSIASVLQFMSGEKVLRILDSARFIKAYAELCPEIPLDSIPFLISLNLGVAKSISGIDAVGPVVDWIESKKQQAGP